MDLSKSRVLVTGGAGLVGSHIVDLLVAEGAHVLVYDSLVRGKAEHLEKARARGKVELVQADLRDREALQAAVKGCDYVFHQAASWLRQCQNEPRLSLEVNVVGTFNLLEACVEHRVKKVVAASSWVMTSFPLEFACLWTASNGGIWNSLSSGPPGDQPAK